MLKTTVSFGIRAIPELRFHNKKDPKNVHFGVLKNVQKLKKKTVAHASALPLNLPYTYPAKGAENHSDVHPRYFHTRNLSSYMFQDGKLVIWQFVEVPRMINIFFF